MDAIKSIATPNWRATIDLLIVDKQKAVGQMIGLALTHKGFPVKATTGCNVDGIHLFRKIRPKLVITSLTHKSRLPSMEMIHLMRYEEPTVQVIVFSDVDDRETILSALAVPVNGFVHKTESVDLLLHAVSVAAQGSSFFSPYVSKMCDGVHLSTQTNKKLGPQELLVLQSVAEGMSTKQTAEHLNLSPKTVENYRGRVMKKLGLNNVASLTRYAIGKGLICLGGSLSLLGANMTIS